MARLPKCAVGMAALLLGQALLSKADVAQPPSGTWTSTGAPMTEARTGACAALLSDGHVLIAGGTGAAGPLATAELYDSGGFFTATTPMQIARASHVCAALQDGRVLVAGGVSTGGDATASAEIYDPTTAAWSIVGEMAQARSAATAIVLKDGRVLVAGGQTGLAVIRSLEMFDPTTRLFAAVGSLSVPRKGHAAALLPDGRVLIAGGTTGPVALASTDIYDPSTGLVSPGPSLSTTRVGLSATALLDGKVLVAGGNDGTADLDSAEVYDPAAGAFSPTAGRLATARRDHLALRLPLNNNVLIVGGMSGQEFAQGAELYAPWNGSFTSTGAPSTPRDGAAASTLQLERQLLVAGGAQSGAELYGFATIKTDKTEYAPGETVVISGSGWQPLETVNVLVQENPKVHDDRSLPLVADQDGNVLNQDLQPEPHDVPLTFSLRAADTVSEAQTTFTDAAAAAPVTSCAGQPNGTLCDDGNPCTEGEKCQNQNCVSGNPAPPSTACSDSNACTTADHCEGKVCVGTPITCTASDQCHNAGTCNPSTGVCSNPAKSDGSACSDGNACTQTDTCQSGTCTGSNPVVCAADQCHNPGTCNPSNGTCSAATNKADGTTCNDGNACTQTDTCQGGTCTGSNPVVCSADQCHNAGTCNPANGTCSAPTNKADGTTCNDGSACTQTDTCQGGTCTGSNPVVCTAQDQCHDAGTCDPTSGMCSNPLKANGSACNDGNACTQTDSCLAGVCVGTNPVVCTASDQCHVVGTCDAATGTCSNPSAPDGAVCNDGNACTQTDTCQAGTCTGSNPVVCTALDQCHDAGTCDTATGTCSSPAKANGTTCDDGNACTQTDTCQAGTCTGSNLVVCTAQDQCHDAGTCNPTSGMCSNPPKANGSACNDGNACTQADACVAGQCVGTNPVVCTPSDQCHVAGTCDAGTGQCSNPAAPDNIACNADNNACTQNDSCQAGVCTAGPAVVCTASDQCHDAGTCDTTTGVCSNPPKANNTACNADNNACTQNDSCQAGICTPGLAVICTASDQCHSAGTCNMATGICSNPVQPNGTSCSDGNACTQTDTCQNGSCQGANPVTCTALDQCHNAGTCNPGTGVCSNPNKSDGTGCNDGNACTQSDSCQAGVCLGSNPVICTALDQCHVAGVCNPTNGLCSSVNAPDGTACNDANECTAGETCQSGTCTGGQTLECKVTGGGQINVVSPNGTANFGFNVQTDPQTGSTKGQLEYNNHATSPPTTYHSVSIDPHSLIIMPISSCTASPGTTGKRATFSGTIKRKRDGTSFPFMVMVEDCGEPGRGKDYFRIQITGAETQGGPLIAGNIQIHGTSVNGTSVTGAGGGVFPPAALYNGVSLQSLTFGKGLTISSNGPAQGQFQALLVGLSALGVTQEIKVEGKAASGSCPGANAASISGTVTVDMGDGTPPVPGVPFTVMVVTNTDGTGSLALRLGATNLPAATVNEGYMTIK